MKKAKKRGFTIVELVIVIAVIAILAAVLIPTFTNIIEKAKESSAKQTAKTALSSVLYNTDIWALPSEDIDGVPATVILVDGFAYGYKDQELVQIDYPGTGETPILKTPKNYDSIFISSSNISNNALVSSVADVLAVSTEFGSTFEISAVGNNRYIYTTDKQVSLLLTDFPQNAVLFTTLGGSSNEDLTLSEEWSKCHGVIPTISDDGKTITYGMYPQTNVSDMTLMAELNALTDPNEFGYYFYQNEYYYKCVATPYEAGYKFESGATIQNGTTYWFKVEPIKWKVLDNEEGTYFITTESILVNHIYSEYYEGTKSKTDYQGNTATVYANNYKYSDTRNWLNTDFYNQAFFLNDKDITVSIVDNSASSTFDMVNPYACEKTNDKLFLLSAKEVTTEKYGFHASDSIKDEARRCKTTDFAKAIGTYISTSLENDSFCTYYLRSPNGGYSQYARYVYSNGDTQIHYQIGGSCHGVRPAMRMKPE